MLDAIDKILIEELQIDGRQTTSELAEKVGLSVPAAAERIRKLQEHGIILRFNGCGSAHYIDQREFRALSGSD
jgi:Lrp/AsnC family leucine-responsive transcriptional regulator